MLDMTAMRLFWLILLYSVYSRTVYGTSLANEPNCINGNWKAGECVCKLGYETTHEVEDLAGALQPVYCNTTVQIVLGAYQWTEEDVLQLAAADLAVVLATASCLAVIHLVGFMLRLYISAQKLKKLRLREKTFIDYMSTYHQEKQLLPTLWTPPSTFQLLNAEVADGTRREKGEDTTEPHQSCIEESDNKTLQTRFTQVLEQRHSNETQEHSTPSLQHTQCSIPGMEDAMPQILIEAGMEEETPLISIEDGMEGETPSISIEDGAEEETPLISIEDEMVEATLLLSIEDGMEEAATLISIEDGMEEAVPLISMEDGMEEAAPLISIEDGMEEAAPLNSIEDRMAEVAPLISIEGGMEEAAPLISIETSTGSKAKSSKPSGKARARSNERSDERVKQPKNTKQDKGTRRRSCSMDRDSQSVSLHTKHTKRVEGDKKPRRRRQPSEDK